MRARYQDLLLQTLEAELGGVFVYSTALKSALNPQLAEEWTEYLDESGRHIEVLYELFDELGLDTDEETAGRLVVRHVIESLIEAMELSRLTDEASAAEVVASECIVLLETKDYANWQVLTEIARSDRSESGKAVQRACEEVDDSDDSRLIRCRQWHQHLLLASLTEPAVSARSRLEASVEGALAAARLTSVRGFCW